MAWDVEYTSEFEGWWHSLSEAEQAEIDAKVELLQEQGPMLPRPYADVIASSRHSNMKELRGKVKARQLRVLYAFDPRRTAVLLIGGDKTGDPKWYEKFVPVADELFDQHLKRLEKTEVKSESSGPRQEECDAQELQYPSRENVSSSAGTFPHPCREVSLRDGVR